MKATQFMILQTIAESGQIAQCDLARDLAASVETLSRRLASARRAGLVDIHAGDRRKQMYSLTAKGRKLLEDALPYWERAEERLQATLDGPDWEMLASFTDRLTAAAIRAESLPLSNRGASINYVPPDSIYNRPCRHGKPKSPSLGEHGAANGARHKPDHGDTAASLSLSADRPRG